MTATSFQACQPTRREEIPQDAFSVALSSAYAEEARRMKAFAGQRKFQAPVADDFTRGMLAAGHSRMGQPNGAWAVLINGLTTWWRG